MVPLSFPLGTDPLPVVDAPVPVVLSPDALPVELEPEVEPEEPPASLPSGVPLPVVPVTVPSPIPVPLPVAVCPVVLSPPIPVSEPVPIVPSVVVEVLSLAVVLLSEPFPHDPRAIQSKPAKNTFFICTFLTDYFKYENTEYYMLISFQRFQEEKMEKVRKTIYHMCK
jgi:hypothetical protein